MLVVSRSVAPTKCNNRLKNGNAEQAALINKGVQALQKREIKEAMKIFNQVRSLPQMAFDCFE